MDEDLLKVLKSDSEKGLIQLMDTYIGLVYSIVKNKLGAYYSKEDIEECVSTVFYELYRERDSIDLSKGSIKSFLAVIAKRRAIDLYREKNSPVNSTECIDKNTVGLNDTGNIVDLETKHVLIEAIKDLGSPDSEMFIRKYYLGQTTKTIAEAFGIKVNTIDKKISRGLAKLREALGGVLIDG